MIHAKGLRTLYLFTVIIACCLLIAGCTKPDDVDCVDLSEQAQGEIIICTDGNEPQVCMAPDSDNCGYYVNSLYIPCESCGDCDTATDVTVALCMGMSPSAESSSTDSTR
jgi:hypothetical protein